MSHTCPVCYYPWLNQEPADHVICPSCGTQFGYHDFDDSHDALRRRWVAGGALWHARWQPAPEGWDGLQQIVLSDSHPTHEETGTSMRQSPSREQAPELLELLAQFEDGLSLLPAWTTGNVDTEERLCHA